MNKIVEKKDYGKILKKIYLYLKRKLMKIDLLLSIFTLICMIIYIQFSSVLDFKAGTIIDVQESNVKKVIETSAKKSLINPFESSYFTYLYEEVLKSVKNDNLKLKEDTILQILLSEINNSKHKEEMVKYRKAIFKIIKTYPNFKNIQFIYVYPYNTRKYFYEIDIHNEYIRFKKSKNIRDIKKSGNYYEITYPKRSMYFLKEEVNKAYLQELEPLIKFGNGYNVEIKKHVQDIFNRYSIKMKTIFIVNLVFLFIIMMTVSFIYSSKLKKREKELEQREEQNELKSNKIEQTKQENTKKLILAKMIEKENQESQEHIDSMLTCLLHDIGTNSNKLLTLMNPIVRKLANENNNKSNDNELNTVYHNTIRIYGMEHFKKQGMYNKSSKNKSFKFPAELISENENFFENFICNPTTKSKNELLNLIQIDFGDVEKQLKDNSTNDRYDWFLIDGYKEKTFSKIIFKLLSNAFKHAMLDNDNKIKLTLKIDNGKFECSIENRAEASNISAETIEKILDSKGNSTLNEVSLMCKEAMFNISVKVENKDKHCYVIFKIQKDR